MKDGDFLRLEYDAFVKETGQIVDTTHEDIAKEHDIYNERVKYGPIAVIVGSGQVVKGLDQDLLNAEVDKEREIYLIDNVKIHLDRVKGLGAFLEIEAQSGADGLHEETLDRQCRQLMDELGVRTEDLMSDSYSDLLMP